MKRTKIPAKVKKKLIAEAGAKCANPGCANSRTHIHHIEHWSVYQTNNPDEMIAVCPSCHDAIHHGRLRISDETVYNWKKIPRQVDERLFRSHMYVEPNHTPMFRLGTLDFRSNNDAIVFSFAGGELKVRMVDDEFIVLDAIIFDTNGRKVVSIVNNNVKGAAEEGLSVYTRPGKFKLTSPVSEKFISSWALAHMRVNEGEFADDGRLTILDVEVLGPGLVKIMGCWCADDRAVIITDESISFCQPLFQQPIRLVGERGESIITFTSTVSEITLFKWEPQPSDTRL